MRKFVFLLFLSFALCAVTEAQSRSNQLTGDEDPRGKAELTVCNQNLANYGSFTTFSKRTGKGPEAFKEKEMALVQRFIRAQCDVIAVQELIGRKKEDAEAAIKQLAGGLRTATNRIFDFRVGPTNDRWSRVGFLVAKDRAKIVNEISYARVELPKLSNKQKPRRFSRGPYEIQLLVKPRSAGARAKTVTLVNFHFKSKHNAKGDPAQLEWETHRMEMAEAVRRVVYSRHKHAYATGQTILIMLGDRNSHLDAASAKILEGVLTLEHFKEDGVCRLSERGVPLCQGGSANPQKMFSVLTSDPQTKYKVGTFRYKKVYSWLDDILMPAESLPFAWQSYSKEGDYDSGVLYLPEEASDHSLTYVRLNW